MPKGRGGPGGRDTTFAKMRIPPARWAKHVPYMYVPGNGVLKGRIARPPGTSDFAKFWQSTWEYTPPLPPVQWSPGPPPAPHPSPRRRAGGKRGSGNAVGPGPIYIICANGSLVSTSCFHAKVSASGSKMGNEGRDVALKVQSNTHCPRK